MRLVLILPFLFWIPAPGASPEMAYVDTPPTTVPPEATYEEDWEVFDPYVNNAVSYPLSISSSLFFFLASVR